MAKKIEKGSFDWYLGHAYIGLVFLVFLLLAPIWLPFFLLGRLGCWIMNITMGIR